MTSQHKKKDTAWLDPDPESGEPVEPKRAHVFVKVYLTFQSRAPAAAAKDI
jgi:hypothetical protein